MFRSGSMPHGKVYDSMAPPFWESAQLDLQVPLAEFQSRAPSHHLTSPAAAPLLDPGQERAGVQVKSRFSRRKSMFKLVKRGTTDYKSWNPDRRSVSPR